MFTVPNFSDEKALYAYLVEKEDDIFYAKKLELKKADGFMGNSIITKSFDFASKANLIDSESIDAVLVINTTKLLDSHQDVHIDGLWDKSLAENKRIKHLQEHKMTFDSIIADKDDLNAYVKNFSWKELGYNAKGDTQALVFESKIRKERNLYMFEQYAKNNVDNHSVGMVYVKMVTCINDNDYPVQQENYEKYAPMVANQKALKTRNFFWAVTEAMVKEGSAVPMGSNFITPTISVKTIEDIKNKSLESYKNWLTS